ncbi:hypothetical protein [Spartinivicinus poritis]|uniref:Uncharacterized protein n=1 Tax=Spartinivicinus poritis TaxID=2994640 RepID=A0ABT5UDA8_9GAMM|nr:hypothetical protein [Spartinivicinus sp. A2-2]MDE1464358.1 hypothetical protein [Spartinivicinus sp. A2-2]
MERLIRLMKPRRHNRPCKPNPDDQSIKPCKKPKPSDVVILDLVESN